MKHQRLLVKTRGNFNKNRPHGRMRQLPIAIDHYGNVRFTGMIKQPSQGRGQDGLDSIVCNACHGTGSVKKNPVKGDTEIITCPACAGNGEIPTYEPIVNEPATNTPLLNAQQGGPE